MSGANTPRPPCDAGSCENAQPLHRFLQTFSRLRFSCFLLFHDRISLEGARRKRREAHDSFCAVYPSKPMQLWRWGGGGPGGPGALVNPPGGQAGPHVPLCPHGCSPTSSLSLRREQTFRQEPLQARAPTSSTQQPEAPTGEGAPPLSRVLAPKSQSLPPATIRSGNRFCGVFLQSMCFSLLWTVPPAFWPKCNRPLSALRVSTRLGREKPRERRQARPSTQAHASEPCGGPVRLALRETHVRKM